MRGARTSGTGNVPLSTVTTIATYVFNNSMSAGNVIELLFPLQVKWPVTASNQGVCLWLDAIFRAGTSNHTMLRFAIGPEKAPAATGAQSTNFFVYNYYLSSSALNVTQLNSLEGSWIDANTYVTRDVVFLKMRIYWSGSIYTGSLQIFDDAECTKSIAGPHVTGSMTNNVGIINTVELRLQNTAFTQVATYDYKIYIPEFAHFTDNTPTLKFRRAPLSTVTRQSGSIEFNALPSAWVSVSNIQELTDVPVTTYTPSVVPNPGSVYTSGGMFTTYLEPVLEDVIADIDDIFTVTKPKFENWPWPAKEIGEAVGGAIADIVEGGTDFLFDGIESIVMNTAYVADGLVLSTENVLKDNAPKFVGFMKRLINFQAVNPDTDYYNVTFLTHVIEAVDENFGPLLSNFKLHNTRVYPKGLIEGGLFPTSFHIPRSFRLRLFSSYNINFNWTDMVLTSLFSFSGPAMKPLKVPGSGALFYDLNHPTEKLRSNIFSDLGFTFNELAEDGLRYGGPVLVLVLVAYLFGPDTAIDVLRRMKAINPFTPTLRKSMEATGLTFDAQWNVVGENLTDKIDAIPTNPFLTTDNRIDHIAEIPSNPLLTTDNRLNSLANLDDTVSSRSASTDMLTMLARLTLARADKLDLLDNVNGLPGTLQGISNAIADIPLNPVLSDDERMDILIALDSWLVKWIKYLSSPMTTVKPAYP